jgi:hypothetical protein
VCVCVCVCVFVCVYVYMCEGEAYSCALLVVHPPKGAVARLREPRWHPSLKVFKILPGGLGRLGPSPPLLLRPSPPLHGTRTHAESLAPLLLRPFHYLAGGFAVPIRFGRALTLTVTTVLI